MIRYPSNFTSKTYFSLLNGSLRGVQSIGFTLVGIGDFFPISSRCLIAFTLVITRLGCKCFKNFGLPSFRETANGRQQPRNTAAILLTVNCKFKRPTSVKDSRTRSCADIDDSSSLLFYTRISYKLPEISYMMPNFFYP